jgi:hypothetical protein
VLRSALVNLVGVRRSVAQLLAELIQEQGNAVIDLRFGRRRRRPLRDFRSAAADEFVSILANEVMERNVRHWPMVRAS